MNREHAQRVLDHMTKYTGPTLVSQRVEPAPAGRGKVFHTKAHERKKGEKYYTPPWATRCLLRQVEFEGHIWEPAAGDGKIIDAFMAQGLQIMGTDLTPDRSDIAPGNFLASTASGRPNIVTNPPFGTGGGLAFQFCWHALRLTERHGGKVAMLLRDDFDSASGRRQLFMYHPAFDKKIVITDRIRWTNLPQEPKAGPSGSHAWFVWDWSRVDAAAHAVVLYERADVDLKDARNWFK